MQTDWVPDANYQKRLDALNFATLHDAGQRANEFGEADVILAGVAGTRKTQVSIWLANRGVKAANFPLMLCRRPFDLLMLTSPFVVGLYGSAEEIILSRQDSFFLFSKEWRKGEPPEVRQAIATEIAYSQALFKKYSWLQVDITGRSIEDVGFAVLDLLTEHRPAQVQ